MQCITPMIRYYQDIRLMSPKEQQRINSEDLKLSAHIIPRHEVLEKLELNENLIRRLEKLNLENKKNGSVWQYQAIPCGHCYACQLRKSAEWATRIMLECQRHEHNYFITFTYNEESLPIATTSIYNGQQWENPGDWTGTLWPDDINRFLNSLRQDLKRNKHHTGVKYYYAGEYCPSSGRPHYHMILMNCPLDITQFYSFKQDPKTKKLHWKSKELERLWNKGFIDVGEVEWSSAAYVARYTMKKLTQESNKTSYYEQGKLPEFVRMSRRPGIAAEYFNENLDKILRDESILMRNYHGDIASYKHPRAWDKKIKELYPEAWEMIKESREAAAKRSQELENDIANYTDLEKLQIKAENIIRKTKLLPREFDYDF